MEQYPAAILKGGNTLKIHIKNQLNSDQTIEFCCGAKEYTLQPDQEIDIEVEDGDCMYFDIVRE